MKALKLCLLAMLASLVLVACKGSNKIVGEWKASASDGTEILISLTKDEISFDGETYAYKQNGTGFVNEARYYSLEVEVDETIKEQLTFILPEKNRKIAILLLPDDVKEPLSGTLLYAMNKEETPDYFEYAEKYMKMPE